MKLGMDHNTGLCDEQDTERYMKRDCTKRSGSNVSPPFKIIRNEIVGRHMVATRDIKAGELIFTETPLNVGPRWNTRPVCLGCYNTRITRDTPACKRCGFPVCSERCSEAPEHRDFECSALFNNNYKVNPQKFSFDDEEEAYAIISPLRLWMLQKLDPERWNLAWMHMSHHESKKKSDYWKGRTKNFMATLSKLTGIKEESDRHTFEVILGIQLVNDFEINPFQDPKQDPKEMKVDSSIRGLFALASIPSHNCVANCTHDFSSRENGFTMTMRSVIKISKGQELVHAYSQPLDPVMTRRSLLHLGKFFQCECVRCGDPTEMGTYTSALVCPECLKKKNNSENKSSAKNQNNSKLGYIISSDIKNMEANWSCTNCTYSIKSDKVTQLTLRMKEESNKLDEQCWGKSGSETKQSGARSIQLYEAFFSKHENISLHPNHVFLIDKKYTLAKMYGRNEGYEANIMTDDQLRRKQKLCEEVLFVFDKIMPGRLRKRGMMMYELHVPLVMLSNQALQRGPASGEDPNVIKQNLKAGLFNLRMGLEILKDEPVGSFEHQIVIGSQESVGQLEEWVKTVCSSI